jgi:PadR family transcriptional regulator, regulatory protein PadR
MVFVRPDLPDRMAESTELLHGTLDTLILKTLSWAPRHGYAIARWIATVTSDALQVEEGSLYPALYRLEKRGWIEAEWGVSETKRRVKFYHLTDVGRERLVIETAQWSRFTDAVAKILIPPPSPGSVDA